MNKIELIKMAFTNLFRRKVRSFLAILGVLIGTTSIVIMISIGLAITDNFEKQMAGNENLHKIKVHAINQGGPNASSPGKKTFKMDDNAVKYIKTIPGVSAVSGSMYLNLNMILDNKYAFDLDLNAIDANEFEKFGIKINEGRGFKPNDEFKILLGKNIIYGMRDIKTGMWMDIDEKGELKNKNINLLSNKVELTSDRNYKKDKIKKIEQSYGGYDPSYGNNSDAPKYEIFKAETIGILASENNSYTSYIDLKSAQKIKESNMKAEKNSSGSTMKNENTYDSIIVYVDDINMVEDICNVLKDSGFYYYSIIDMIREMQKSFFIVQATLGGIGAISLLVAAIGITNTMIMSIYERTREIGIMKVLGARLSDIKNMFLYEAAFIGLIGGVVGSIISILISLGLNKILAEFATDFFGTGYGEQGFTAKLSYIPPWLIISAIAFSTIIGIIAGFFPARRAMKMSALSSLRNE